MQYRSVHVTAVFPAHDTYKSSILRLRLRAAAAADAPSYAVCRLPAMWRRRRRPSPRLAPLLRQCRPKHGLETPPSLSLSPLPPINPQPNPIKHSLTGCRNPPPSPPPRPTLPFPPSPSSLPPLLLLRSPSPSSPPLSCHRSAFAWKFHVCRPEWSCTGVRGGRGAASRSEEKSCLD